MADDMMRTGSDSAASSSSRAQASSSMSYASQDMLPDMGVWKLLQADGRTPQEGIVLAKRDYGVLVRLFNGCKGLAVRDWGTGGAFGLSPHEFEQIREGEKVITYVVGKHNGTGKLKLSFSPRADPIIRLQNVHADGCHPYRGVVTGFSEAGMFVDIGCEVPGLVPQSGLPEEESEPLVVGSEITVYALYKGLRKSRLKLSLQPLEVPLLFWRDVPADGQTPLQGTVIDFDGIHFHVDIGLGVHGTLPMEEGGAQKRSHDLNSQVVVYVVGRDWFHQTLMLSSVRQSKPRISLESLVADGQTPHQAEVLCRSRDNGWVLDIGCDKNAFLADDDPVHAARKLRDGDRLTVFIHKKTFGQAPLEARSVRQAAPRERLQALVSDGVTPYQGVVRNVKALGWFMDIGSEVSALLLRSTVKDPSGMPGAGGQVPVYIWNKSLDVGKVYVRLEPRPTAALTFEDIVADGVTPYEGTVLRLNDSGTYIDIGCEQISVLKRADLQADRAALAALTEGDAVTVYARGKNHATKNIALTTSPAARRRLQFADVRSDTAYDGLVVRKLHKFVFVDFHCEVTGVVDTGAHGPCSAQLGDVVRVQPALYDAKLGRWQVVLVT